MTQNTRSHTSNHVYTNIKTNPQIITTYTQPFTNAQIINTNPSITPTYNTVPPSTIPQSTVSKPTYITSSTSISKPIKIFDGLHQNYTPEEPLQHNEGGTCYIFIKFLTYI